MQTLEYTIKDKVGIHARPAAELVKNAGSFESDIQITLYNKTANAKSILSVMQLGAKYGDTLSVTFEGVDEKVAKDSVEAFLKGNL
ncbi:MAG: HPr family phosphocarrier protein [Candidatus Ancillula sp.]|jgi:phosphocarrier protein|nr:HPr family phosphocarrier protein [Candidatus Ancillula sp.]